MTKHSIIAGVPRAGKSTVSQMIAKKYGYQHISMDSIIAGFEKAFPQVGIDNRRGYGCEGKCAKHQRENSAFYSCNDG